MILSDNTEGLMALLTKLQFHFLDTKLTKFDVLNLEICKPRNYIRFNILFSFIDGITVFVQPREPDKKAGLMAGL